MAGIKETLFYLDGDDEDVVFDSIDGNYPISKGNYYTIQKIRFKVVRIEFEQQIKKVFITKT